MNWVGMNWKLIVAAVTGAAVLGLALAPSPAEAAKRKYVKRYAVNYSYKSGPRTRIYVTRRSWLDGGTEVLPGERKYHDYAYPVGLAFGDSVTSYGASRRMPLPYPWELPGNPGY